MISLTNLNRQHTNIYAEVNFLEEEIGKGKQAMNCMELSLHISKLAGLIKIHLLEEDKFLYPNLLNCPDTEMKTLANQYIQEMGNLMKEYTEFKNSYNISNRISENADEFLAKAKIIIRLLKERINREDRELYNLIEKKKL